ncbi:MAG: response regulator transcription factor, partial [Anaerolineae bacterium]
EEGYAVDTVGDGQEALDYAAVVAYDLIVLDVMLPAINGLDVCQSLRNERNKVPVLMLTARDTVDDRVAGLESGADDYLVKPFAFAELLARIRALLRRTGDKGSSVLRVGDLELDVRTHQASRGERAIELTQREYALLEYLMRHPGQVLSHTQIGEHVWGFDFYTTSNIVAVYIRYLRRKIDEPGKPPLIHTVRGAGYKIQDIGQ